MADSLNLSVTQVIQEAEADNLAHLKGSGEVL